MLRAEGVRSVQSTPLVSRSGRILGTFTTHGIGPHQWSRRELRLVDLLAREAADFIERAQAEAQLKQADRHKDEFLAILAHELRNPLAPIRYAVSVTRASASSEEQRRGAEAVIERQVAQMSRLLDDLLDVSRIARGTVKLRKERFVLRNALGAAIEASRPLVDAKRHELVVRAPDEALVVEADPVRLTQVLTNLINNAAKYTDAAGRIEVVVEQSKAELVVRVIDNGVGIAPEVRPRLFTLFAQADGAVQRAEGGLGIGLALVKGFVELHGGTIEARSEGRNRGAEFVVRLPVVVERAQASQRAGAAPGAPGLTVVVADDNPDICETCSTLLEVWGHHAHAACDGAQALELIRDITPDVALLDIGMPGMSGYEVARKVREEHGAGVVLIAVTGWGQDEAKGRAREAGFDHHLTKPVDPDRLAELLGHVHADRTIRRARDTVGST